MVYEPFVGPNIFIAIVGISAGPALALLQALKTLAQVYS